MAPRISQLTGNRVAGLILVLAMTAAALPASAGDASAVADAGTPVADNDAIHDILYDSQLSASERGFAAAEKLLADTADSLRAILPPGGDWVIAQQHANLDLVKQLMAVDGTYTDPFLQALEDAQVASSWQASALGFTDSSVTPLAGYESASEAVYALLASHNVEADAEQRAEIDALDQQPAEFSRAFARMVDAFMALEAAAERAFAEADIDSLLALQQYLALLDSGYIGTLNGPTSEVPSPGEIMRRASFDVGSILLTRNQFLEALQHMTITVDTVDLVDVKFTSGATAVPPVIAFDVRGFANSFYDENFIFTFDIQGDDIYHNNAGGSNILSTTCMHLFNPVPIAIGPVIALGPHSRVGPGVAAAVDLSGNDAYGDPANPRNCGANGGGNVGVGILADRSGVDTYIAGHHGVMGGAHFGVGLAVDGSGDDSYTGTRNGVNGGGDYVGVGLLVDRSENDVYQGTAYGVNGGGIRGMGLLLDMAGNDRYTADNRGTNGGGDGGVGVIVDNTGNDYYDGGTRGSNGGGYFVGVGMILDGGENDVYVGGSRSSSGSGDFGVGLIIDLAGQDSYPAGPDQTILPKGAVGAQIDIPHLPAI